MSRDGYLPPGTEYSDIPGNEPLICGECGLPISKCQCQEEYNNLDEDELE